MSRPHRMVTNPAPRPRGRHSTSLRSPRFPMYVCSARISQSKPCRSPRSPSTACTIARRARLSRSTASSFDTGASARTRTSSVCSTSGPSRSRPTAGGPQRRQASNTHPVRASACLSTSSADIDRLIDAVTTIANGSSTPVAYRQDQHTGDFWPDSPLAGWTARERRSAHPAHAAGEELAVGDDVGKARSREPMDRDLSW